MNNGIRLRNLLELGIEDAFKDIPQETLMTEEMLMKIGSDLHSVDKHDNIFEIYLSESTMGRLRIEMIQLNEQIGEFFTRIPDTIVDDLHIVDFDGSPRDISLSEWESIKEYFHSFLMTDKLIQFFSMAYELLKIRTAELVSQEILASKYSGESGRNWILENKPISYRHRPEFLMRCGVIDPQLVKNIKTISDFRGKLVHELEAWHQIESSDKLIQKIETCTKTIEQLDEKLGYPPQIRFSKHEDPIERLGINIEDIRDTLNKIEDPDFDDATDAIGKEMVSHALKNENSPFREEIERYVHNDDKLVRAFENFYQNELSHKNGDDFEKALYSYAGTLRDEFGVNLFRILSQRKERFESRLPKEVFSEKVIQIFDSETNKEE